MPEETQEPTALTTEQQQRTHAVMTAAEVLRPRPVRTAIIGAGESVASLSCVDWTEVVRLADYIVRGVSEPTTPMFIAMGWGQNHEEPDADDDGTDEDESETDGDVGLRLVADMLSLVHDEVPGGMVFSLVSINDWTPAMRVNVVKWAGAVHMRASDNDVEIPPAPSVLHRYDCAQDLDHQGKCVVKARPIKDTPQA